jgi:AbrB family looped-hinge helix DNA binding protein
MSEAKMTSKGQITVPKEVRVKLNLKAGDRVLFILQDDGSVRLRAANKDISSLRGILPAPKRALTIEEMDEGIARAVAEDVLGHDWD